MVVSRRVADGNGFIELKGTSGWGTDCGDSIGDLGPGLCN